MVRHFGNGIGRIWRLVFLAEPRPLQVLELSIASLLSCSNNFSINFNCKFWFTIDIATCIISKISPRKDNQNFFSFFVNLRPSFFPSIPSFV